MTTRMETRRERVLIDKAQIDHLELASPVPGLGSKVGMDATNKWEGETDREWGEAIAMDSNVKDRIDEIWKDLNIDLPGR